jgi:hypothetical protein
VIVDATRSSTKRFPDAFSKTVPIWAAVLNRAVHRHHQAAAGTPGAAVVAAAGVCVNPPVGLPFALEPLPVHCHSFPLSLLAPHQLRAPSPIL